MGGPWGLLKDAASAGRWDSDSERATAAPLGRAMDGPWGLLRDAALAGRWGSDSERATAATLGSGSADQMVLGWVAGWADPWRSGCAHVTMDAASDSGSADRTAPRTGAMSADPSRAATVGLLAPAWVACSASPRGI